MGTITSEDYTAAIRRKYDVEKQGRYSSFLLNPSPAQLRNLCLIVFDQGLSNADESTFANFFQTEQSDSLRKSIERVDVERFKSFKNFLLGKNDKISPPSLEVIAVLLDMNPRPLRNFLTKQVNKGELPSNEATGKEETIVVNENEVMESTVRRKATTGAKRLIIPILIIGLLFVAYIVKKEFFPSKECIQWNVDHYEEVVCEGNQLGFANINPIFERDEDLLDFKKLKVDSTTVFFKEGQPIVWYAKRNGKCEFFNGPGLHPLTGKPLMPITEYMVEKYVWSQK